MKIPEDIKQALHTILTALQEQLPTLQPITFSEALPTKVPRCCHDRTGACFAFHEHLKDVVWLTHIWRRVHYKHAIQ